MDVFAFEDRLKIDRWFVLLPPSYTMTPFHDTPNMARKKKSAASRGRQEIIRILWGSPDQPAVLNSIEICQSEGLHFRMLGSYVLGEVLHVGVRTPRSSDLAGNYKFPW